MLISLKTLRNLAHRTHFATVGRIDSLPRDVKRFAELLSRKTKGMAGFKRVGGMVRVIHLSRHTLPEINRAFSGAGLHHKVEGGCARMVLKGLLPQLHLMPSPFSVKSIPLSKVNLA